MSAAPTWCVIMIRIILQSFVTGHSKILGTEAEAVAGCAVDVVYGELAAGIVVEGPVNRNTAARIGVPFIGEHFEVIDSISEGKGGTASILVESANCPCFFRFLF